MKKSVIIIICLIFLLSASLVSAGMFSDFWNKITGHTTENTLSEGTIFVTSNRYDGDFGGLSGADDECQAEAESAGYSGSWIALLSDSSTDVIDRISDTEYKNIKGETIASDMADLFDGSIDGDIGYHPDGSSTGGSWVRTGSNSEQDGLARGGDVQNDNYQCEDWTCNTASCRGTEGFPGDLNGWLFRAPGSDVCSTTYKIYCILTEDTDDLYAGQFCTPDEIRCGEWRIEQCNDGGTSWTSIGSCNYGCDSDTLSCITVDPSPPPCGDGFCNSTNGGNETLLNCPADCDGDDDGDSGDDGNGGNGGSDGDDGNSDDTDSDDASGDVDEDDEDGEESDDENVNDIPGDGGLVDDGDFCRSGCLLDEVCYPLGYRIKKEYCSVGEGFIEQLKGEENCSNSFECESNLCLDDKCIKQGFFMRIINWFKRLFRIG